MAEDKELAEELRLWRKERSAQPVGKSGEIPLQGFEDFNKQLGPAAQKLGPLAAGAGTLGKGFEQLRGILESSVTTFRGISNVGASFSNDIVGMTAAAVGARVGIKEFGEIIKDNAKLVAGLGGNITQSVEQFSKLSKEMFDEHSRTTNQLETLGYTTKDLNEVLALSTYARRTSDLKDANSRKEAIESATKLAFEMDAMAKLTGKSREQQQEEMKKALLQGQLEAKFLMIRAKEGEAAEKVARAKYQEALTSATAAGKQQELMEGFITGGGALTQATGNMLALSQGSREYAKLGGELSKSNRSSVDAATASNRALAASNADLSKTGFLQAAMISDATNGMTDGARKQVEVMSTYNRNLQQIQEDEFKRTGKRISNEEAAAIAANEVKMAQQGMQKQADGTYKKVDGANQAMVQLNSAARTVASSLVNGMLPAINKVQDGLGKLGNRLLTQEVTAKGPKGETTTVSTAKAIEEPLRTGVQRGLGELPEKEQKKDKFGAAIPTVEKTPGANILEGGGEALGKTIKTFGDIGNKVLSNSRDSGTLGKTGMMFEPSDFLGMVHKGETVLTPKQMESFVKGVQQSGMVDAVQNMAKSITPDATGNIDINKMMSGVNTTLSSVQKSPPKAEDLLGDFMSGPMFGKKQSVQYTESSEETKEKRKALNDEYRAEQNKLAKEIYKTIPASYSAEQRAQAIQENAQMLALKEKHRQQTLKLLEDEGKDKGKYGESERKVLEQGNEWKKNILKEGQLAQTSLLKNTQAEQKQLLATGNQKSVTETVTGGGSTLRQVVDTPEKVKLEKEQNELLETYRQQRKAIADKIKKETGVQGKSLFEAMEASPEALALKANFEKQNDDYSRKILNERQAVTEILAEDEKLSKEKVKTVKKDLESNLTSSKKQTAAQEGKTAASLEELRLAVHDATAKKQKSADDRDYHGQVEYLANVKLNEAKKDFEKDKSEKNRQRVEEAQRTVDSTKKTAALVRAKDDENQQKLDNARKSFLDAKKKSTEIDKKTSTPKTTEAVKDNAPKNTILGTDGKVDLNAFSMGPNGLPIVNQLQAKAREIPDAVNPKETPEQADARKKAAGAAAAKTESISKKSESKAGPGAGKTATLDDVVTRLDTLNSRIGQLIEQSSDIGQRQVRATKSNNQNLYAR